MESAMYVGLRHSHSALMYVVLLLLVLSTVKSFMGWMQKSEHTKLDKNLGLFTLISTHIMLLLGLGLYFVSPNVNLGDIGAAMKDPVMRFFTVEHISLMVIGIVLITIGYSKSKRATDATSMHKTKAIFFGLGLLLILARIPWDRVLGS